MKNITILVLVVIILIGGVYLVKKEVFNKNLEGSPTNTAQENADNTNSAAEAELKAKPDYCQTDEDCVAIPNPSNACYFGYFNINATTAIAEFKNNSQIMIQDCPVFSETYCNNNKCVADRK